MAQVLIGTVVDAREVLPSTHGSAQIELCGTGGGGDDDGMPMPCGGEIEGVSGVG